MRGMIFGAFAVLVMLQPSHATSAEIGFENGNTLKALCDSSKTNPVEFGICLGYTQAISDVMNSNLVNGYRACAPSGVNSGQTKDVVMLFLNAHPELRHFAAAGLVANALENAFPCGK